MDQFIYIPEFRITVYRKCQYAVLPSHIDTHFATKPHKLDKQERQRILEEVAEINGLINNEETLRSEFSFPQTASAPIAALGKPETNGLQCIACQYICCTVQRMRTHQ
jgi:Orsellinic acid/F9775 biosynthesis cluster protein D